jgi:hypothetical protein
MGLILGFLIGLISTVGLFGFLIYWLCSRSNNVAVAKFINGIALALAHKPKSSEPLPSGENEATDVAKETRNEKARER